MMYVGHIFSLPLRVVIVINYFYMQLTSLYPFTMCSLIYFSVLGITFLFFRATGTCIIILHLNFACSKHPVTFHKSCWNGYVNWLLMKAFLLRQVFVLVCHWRGLVIVLQAGLDVFNWNAHFSTAISGLVICPVPWESHFPRK